MSQNPPPSPKKAHLIARLAPRLLMIFLVGTVMVWVVQRSSQSFDRSTQPAGFARGMLHGALMPMALPNLVIGQDITIYTVNNTGRAYKLGYTVGVNGCGLIFFGFFFWRLNRLRRRLQPLDDSSAV